MHFKEIDLYTQDIEKQYDFYASQLGLTCSELSGNSFIVTIGDTIIRFNNKADCTPYHFAINIPYLSVDDALVWVKQRVTVLKDGDSEIQLFDNWHAEAIYFYDADNNIVELIGREKTDYVYSGVFDTSCLKAVSEIGVATDDIAPLFETLNTRVDLKIYDGNVNRFCAIGDEYGLFICIDFNEKKSWYPTDDKPSVSDFTALIIHHNQTYKINYLAGKLAVANS